MAAKPRKSKSKKTVKAPAISSSVVSALFGTVLNMTATLMTVGSVFLCLVAAKQLS